MPITRQAARELTDAGRSKWDEGIEDAKAKIRSLRETIAVYRARQKSGDPWPGDSAITRPDGGPATQ